MGITYEKNPNGTYDFYLPCDSVNSMIYSARKAYIGVTVEMLRNLKKYVDGKKIEEFIIKEYGSVDNFLLYNEVK